MDNCIEQVVFVNMRKVMDYATFHSGAYTRVAKHHHGLLKRIKSIDDVPSVLGNQYLASNLIDARKMYFDVIFHSAVELITDMMFGYICLTYDVNKKQPTDPNQLVFKSMRVYQVNNSLNLPLYGDGNFDFQKMQEMLDHGRLSWEDNISLFIKPNHIVCNEFEHSITVLSFENSIGCIKFEVLQNSVLYRVTAIAEHLKSADKRWNLATLMNDFPFEETHLKLIEFNYKYGMTFEKVYTRSFGSRLFGWGDKIEFAK